VRTAEAGGLTRDELVVLAKDSSRPVPRRTQYRKACRGDRAYAAAI
jgi:hypothetical protein